MDQSTLNPKMAYKVAEAAEKIGLSRSFVYEMIHSGKLRTIKIGRSRRITPAQLQEFLERPEFED